MTGLTNAHISFFTCDHCGGKRAYPSRSIARKVAQQMNGTGTSEGKRIRAYRCDVTDAWHLTSERASTAEWYRENR